MNVIDLSSLDRKKARIEIIPLIDVVFFLLATFVLFTLSLNKITALDTDLPKSGGEPMPGEDTTVYIHASDGGTYYWKQGRQTTPELVTEVELAPRLVEYRSRVAEPRVFVRGDAKAHFGPAVRALDEVRKAGIRQVSIETVTSNAGS